MKPLLIIDAFVKDITNEKTLHEFLDSVKTIGDDVLLMSNTQIPISIQDKINYFFYDKRNQLFKEKYLEYPTVNYWLKHDAFKVTTTYSHSQPHGLAVLISLFHSVKIAKELGYTYFYKMEYDAILGEETKNKIKKLNNLCETNNKKGIFFIEKHGDKQDVEAHYFLCEVDYFLNNFWNITCEQDYINYLKTKHCNHNFITMERFMGENIQDLPQDDVLVYENFYNHFSDTYWNSQSTRVYDDKKYKDCVTRFYLKVGFPNEIIIYSINKKSTPYFRKIIVIFNDGNKTELIHEFIGHGSYVYNILPNNIEKIIVYDKNEVLLYEEKFVPTVNFIEFD